ncbi:MAG: hypothetical protein ABI190_05455 [Casimicrobiaceae bacterium]
MTIGRAARTLALLPWLIAGCASMPATSIVDGMPVDAFIDDLKAQLREVHWHVRGSLHGCSGDLREVDLRDAGITLVLDRLEQVEAGASAKLVAVPLAGIALAPSASADVTRRNSQQLTLKLAVDGDVPVIDFDHAPAASAPVAQAINAAIDGFMRASSDAPCVRLAALKLELVVDVQRTAAGAFKVVVPAIAIDAGTSRRSVNTLTLDWTHIVSRALH